MHNLQVVHTILHSIHLFYWRKLFIKSNIDGASNITNISKVHDLLGQHAKIYLVKLSESPRFGKELLKLYTVYLRDIFIIWQSISAAQNLLVFILNVIKC